MSDHAVSRRYFFFGSILAGAVPSAGFGSVPSLRTLGYKPYYDKLNVAAIGCGGQAGVILNGAARTENIVALCDVDWNRGAANLKKFEKAAKYRDFRVMLDKEATSIDACTIGVPDFMHATAALECMQRGKHVYVEKPLTRTPWEARLLQEAAVKYKVATQMGNQGYSHECNRVAAEIVWSGEIGEVTEAHISTSPGTFPTNLRQLPPEDPVPETLAWDLWLGAAPPRPFSKYYVPYNWRGFHAFGSGQIGNWATHTAGPVQTALQLGAPLTVERLHSTGDTTFTYPESAVVRLDFPARDQMPPVAVYYYEAARSDDPHAYRVPGMENEVILPPINNLWDKGRSMDGGVFPERVPQPRPATPRGPAGGPRVGAGGPGVRVFGKPDPESKPGILSENGAVFIGTKGIMATSGRGEGVWLLPASRWSEYVLPPQLLTRSPGHMRDWLRACKGGERSCSDFSISGPFAEWLALAAIALHVPGKLQWDSKNVRITNNADADRFVRPAFRKGRELKMCIVDPRFQTRQ